MDEVWVVVRSSGEYSDRIETPIRYCLSEADAMRAVELTAIEAQRDAARKPVWRRLETHGFMLPNGVWLDDRDVTGGRFARKPDADKIAVQNEALQAEYDAACLALGHVDPAGSWSGDDYYYALVTIWPAPNPSPAG